MSAVPTYSKIESAPPEWQTLKQVDADLQNAQCDKAGGIVIKGETYSIQAIAKRIFALRPDLPQYTKRSEKYLAIAKKFKAIVDHDSITRKPLYCRGFCACFCFTSSCKERVILADSELTMADLHDWISDMQAASAH